MNLGLSLIIFLIVICSCKAQRIGFGELDYVANEGEGMASVVLVVSESASQTITVPLLVMSFGEYFTPDRPRLPSDFANLDLPDAAEYSEDGSGRRDFVRNQTIEVTFPPSISIQEQEVFIPLVDDNINEAVEGFLVILDSDRFSIINPEVTITDTIRGGITVVRIEDNDPITLMFEEDEYSVEETQEEFPNTIFVTKGDIETEQQLEVLVQRSSAMASTASKGPNMDYDINDIQRLIFPPSSIALPVPFEVFSDEIPEDIEQFSLFLTVAETRSGFTLGRPSRTTVSIVDDDDLVIGFEEPSYTVIEGEMVEVCIKVNEPDGEIDLVAPISIMSMDGTAILADNDYEEVATFSLLPNFDGSRRTCFNVTTTENDISEPSKNFMIEFNFTIATSPNAKTDIRITNIVIQDDDAPQDPCASANCHADADCVSAGSDTFQCICRRGFVGNGASCRDVCSEGANDCHAQADCIKTDNPEGFQCVCQSGFTGNGRTCVDVCSPGANDCHAQALCIRTNTTEGFRCVCQGGFVGDGRLCIDPCSEGFHNCHAQANCSRADNAVGFQCTCQRGFVGDGRICKDACSDNDCHVKAECIKTNNAEGFKCSCQSGYVGDGRSCEIIPGLCRVARDCHPNATCMLSSGFMLKCRCNDGYEGDGKENCDDINECLSSRLSCHSDAICVNTDGGYHCLCKSGFIGDGIICVLARDPEATTNPPATTTAAMTSPSTEPPLCDTEQDVTGMHTPHNGRSNGRHRHGHIHRRHHHHHHQHHHSNRGHRHSSVHDHRSGTHDHSTAHSRKSDSSSSSHIGSSMYQDTPCVTEPQQDSLTSARSNSISKSRSHTRGSARRRGRPSRKGRGHRRG